RLDQLKRALEDSKARLADKMKSLEPRRAEWERQILSAYGAGELAWRVQRPTGAKAANGAVLTVYNDQDVDYTSYEGGTLAGTRAPGNGVIIATGPNPDNETYTVTLQPGAGRWKQLGLEVVMDENLPGLRVARGADRLVITELGVEAGGRNVPFVTGKSNLSNQAPEYLPAGAIDGGPKTGWAMHVENKDHKSEL